MTHGLGRKVAHDERSRTYPALVAAGKPKTVDWPIHAPVLDQGQVGSCTGNAMAQWLNTDYAAPARAGRGYFTENDAVSIYSAATKIDNAPGVYPPTDTGSAGLFVAKVAKTRGLIRSYAHCFGFAHFAAAMQVSPMIVGIDWYAGMNDPDKAGLIKVHGGLEGGHEILVRGLNVEKQRVRIRNSWSSSWGLVGEADISFADFTLLLSRQGDLTVPVL